MIYTVRECVFEALETVLGCIPNLVLVTTLSYNVTWKGPGAIQNALPPAPQLDMQPRIQLTL